MRDAAHRAIAPCSKQYGIGHVSTFLVQVLLLEDDKALRMVLRYYLEESGWFTVIDVGSLFELEAKVGELSAVHAAVLDINLGPGEPSGIDAYRWLRAHRFAGRVIFLTGHARNHPIVKEAHAIRDAIVLEKPAGIQDIASALLKGAA